MNSRRTHLPHLTSRSWSAAAASLVATVALSGCGSGSGGGKKALAAAKAAVGQQVGAANATMQQAFTPDAIASTRNGTVKTRIAARSTLATSAEAAVRALGGAYKAAAKQPSLKPLAAKLLAAQASLGSLTVVLRSGKTPPKSLMTGSVASVESAVNASRDAGVTVKATFASTPG